MVQFSSSASVMIGTTSQHYYYQFMRGTPCTASKTWKTNHDFDPVEKYSPPKTNTSPEKCLEDKPFLLKWSLFQEHWLVFGGRLPGSLTISENLLSQKGKACLPTQEFFRGVLFN